MFAKYLALALLFLSASLQVHAHAAIAPVLGLKAAPKRSDVKRPSGADPCGAGVNIAQELGSSQAVTANGNSFTVTVTNFNAGQDGSRDVSATVDPTGTGKKFEAVTVSKNGDGNPTNVGSQQVTASLPAGTKCTGGAKKNLCLVAFKTTSGFGNCVAVQQGAAAKGGKRYAGTRLPRALLASVEETAQVAKRDLLAWIWA